ncbi:MAG: hypothetical protein ACQESH_06155 [Campylobacterota bacterium]
MKKWIISAIILAVLLLFGAVGKNIYLTHTLSNVFLDEDIDFEAIKCNGFYDTYCDIFKPSITHTNPLTAQKQTVTFDQLTLSNMQKMFGIQNKNGDFALALEFRGLHFDQDTNDARSQLMQNIHAQTNEEFAAALEQLLSKQTISIDLSFTLNEGKVTNLWIKDFILGWEDTVLHAALQLQKGNLQDMKLKLNLNDFKEIKALLSLLDKEFITQNKALLTVAKHLQTLQNSERSKQHLRSKLERINTMGYEVDTQKLYRFFLDADPYDVKDNLLSTFIASLLPQRDGTKTAKQKKDLATLIDALTHEHSRYSWELTDTTIDTKQLQTAFIYALAGYTTRFENMVQSIDSHTKFSTAK